MIARRRMYVMLLATSLVILFWNPSVSAEDSLDFYVHNVDGSLVEWAHVLMFDESWNYLDDAWTDASGKVTFTGFSEGTYNFETHYPGPVGGWRTEYWGDVQLYLSPGSNTHHFTRFMPWSWWGSLWVGDTLNNERSVFYRGETVRVKLVVQNDCNFQLPVRMIVVWDDNEQRPYKFQGETAPYSISGFGGTHEFAIEYTTSPSETATSMRLAVWVNTTLLNNNVKVTDSWIWTTRTITLVQQPWVNVNTPNGGEIWHVGNTHPITWSAGGGFGSLTVDLSYSTTGLNGFYNTIATGLSNTGSYPWSIPDDPSTNSYVKAIVRDSNSQTSTDKSNGAFTIRYPPGVVVLSFDFESSNDTGKEDGYVTLETLTMMEQIDSMVNAYGLRASVYVQGAALDNAISGVQFRQVIESLMVRNEIGTHTYHHWDLTTLTRAEIDSEIEMTESSLGAKLYGLRAPFFAYDSEVLSSLSAHGYLYDTSEWYGDIPQDDCTPYYDPGYSLYEVPWRNWDNPAEPDYSAFYQSLNDAVNFGRIEVMVFHPQFVLQKEQSGLFSTLLSDVSSYMNSGDIEVLTSWQTVAKVFGIGQPDLAVSGVDITFFPTDTSVLVRAMVHNIGGAPATNILVRFYDGDPASGGTEISSSTIPSLEAGLMHNVTITWNPSSPGTHDIFIVVDPQNTIPELSEANNIAHSEVFVPPDLDFAIELLISDKVDYGCEETAYLWANVRNNGTKTLDAIDALFELRAPNGTIIHVGWDYYSYLDPGALRTFEVTWDVQVGVESGFYDILVTITAWEGPGHSGRTILRYAEATDAFRVSCWAGPPRPPTNFTANLGDASCSDIVLTWTLSIDDESGNQTVTSYRIRRSQTFVPDGSSYGLVATAPAGTSEFIDNGVGEGDPSNYFYLICAEDVNGNVTCSSTQAGKFTHQLSSGPNLVSVPLIQSDESIVTVLQTVKYDKAWYYDSISHEWRSHMMFKSYGGDLEGLNHTMGMWVNVTEDSNLTVAGGVPVGTRIHLNQGWNLIGFPSFDSTFSVANLKVLVPVDRVEGFDASASPGFLKVLQDSDILEAGLAYWVRVQWDSLLVISN